MAVSPISNDIVDRAIVRHLDVMACPACGAPLHIEPYASGLRCATQHTFRCDTFPLLFWPNEWSTAQPDVTGMIRTFYEATPFPGYEDIDSVAILREKAERSAFAKWLNEQIPHGARILEVGCGTGQLSNYLGAAWGHSVFGADLSVNSLRLAYEFKQRNRIDNTTFLQMNLFRPAFRPEVFDIVICNGVLHHTSNPFLGFQSIARLVKPGGFIIIGLYNKYGRIPTYVRKAILRPLPRLAALLDSRLRSRDLSESRKKIWFMDQYRNPHESAHTIGEVQTWCDHTAFSFVNGIPKPRAFEPVVEGESLFSPTPRGSRLDHIAVQIGLLFTGTREGGFFVTIGQKLSGKVGDESRRIASGSWRETMAFWKRAWRRWIGTAKHIGDFQARVLLTLVYFVVLLPVSAIVTTLSDPLHLRAGASPAWSSRDNEPPGIERARRQS